MQINMRHETSKKIYSYWDRLRKNRPAPDRCEIEPSDIREMLGDTFILEIDKSFNTISFRLAGTRLCGAYGRELKGVGFLGLWGEEENLTVFNAVRQVYKEYKACTIGAIAQSEGNKFVEFEILMLPLSTGQADGIRILGVATPKKNLYWLGSDPLVQFRLNAIRFNETQQDGFVTPTSKQLNTEPSYVDLPAQTPFRRVKHLTVLDGGRQIRSGAVKT